MANLRKLIVDVVLVVFLAQAATLADAQQPVTDGLSRPLLAFGVPSAEPRFISSNRVLSEFFNTQNSVVTRSLDIDLLMEEDKSLDQFGPYRIGIVQTFSPKSNQDGIWTELDDGGYLWTMSFRALNAVAIRLRISHFRPPAGAELIIHVPGPTQYSIGPFTDEQAGMSDTFWTPTLYGEEAYLEYYIPAGINHESPQVQIEVDALLNQYRDLIYGLDKEVGCHLDVSCYPAWQDEADAVGHLSYIHEGAGYTCTGSLYNRVPEDYTPLLATAWHCDIYNSNINSLVVTWFYQTTSCDGSVPSFSTLPQTIGIVNLADDNASDYRLIGLDWDVPGGLYYLGWDANEFANGSAATCIHHPDGSHKRITIGEKISNTGTCVCSDCYKISWPQGQGVTEGGSSGSPIMDSNQRARGALSGCGPFECDQDNHDWYGRFDAAYNILEPWLDPVDPVYVDNTYTGTEQGTVSQPFNTYVKGIYAVIAGSDLYIEAGNYGQTMTLKKPMTIHARNGTVILGQD